MLDLQQQREGLEAKLESVPVQRKQPSAKQIAARLWTLEESLRDGSPAVVRHALSQLVHKIVLEFVPGRGVQGKRLKSKAIGGVICANNDQLSKQLIAIGRKEIRLKLEDFERFTPKDDRRRMSFGFGSSIHGAVPIAAEQKVIGIVRKRLAKGVARPAIAAELNSKGMLNRGEPWTRWSIKKINTAAARVEALEKRARAV